MKTTTDLALSVVARGDLAIECGRRPADVEAYDAARPMDDGDPLVIGTRSAEARLMDLPAEASERDAIAAVGDVRGTLLRDLTGRGWRAAGHLGGWYFWYGRGPYSECRQRAERVVTRDREAE